MQHASHSECLRYTPSISSAYCSFNWFLLFNCFRKQLFSLLLLFSCSEQILNSIHCHMANFTRRCNALHSSLITLHITRPSHCPRVANALSRYPADYSWPGAACGCSKMFSLERGCVYPLYSKILSVPQHQIVTKSKMNLATGWLLQFPLPSRALICKIITKISILTIMKTKQ